MRYGDAHAQNKLNRPKAAELAGGGVTTLTAQHKDQRPHKPGVATCTCDHRAKGDKATTGACLLPAWLQGQ